MTKVPSLGYEQVVRALQRDGWVVVRQKAVISVSRSIPLMKFLSSPFLHTILFSVQPSPIF